MAHTLHTDFSQVIFEQKSDSRVDYTSDLGIKDKNKKLKSFEC